MGLNERVFIGLGANLGDAAQTLRAAIAAIAALPGTHMKAQSALYLSAPVDAEGPEFTNSVIEVETALEPLGLFQALQVIETEQGRQRPYRNAPRTLDLDLLLYGTRSLITPTLTVPHPRLHQRAFTLLPLLELAPSVTHPILGRLALQVPTVANQVIRKAP